jgi:hypothetical protein
VFDRRPQPENRPNMDVVVDVDEVEVADCILRVLAQAG